MRATAWEFRFRALIIGLIFGAGFAAYGWRFQNGVIAFSNWAGAGSEASAHLIARLLLTLAALLIAAAALFRTWGTAYLHARVVYSSRVQTQSLVGDGPFRYVRNPLYFGNLLLVVGIAALMSWPGGLFAIVAMVIFGYRLIGREESELAACHGESYRRYQAAVPRLWPALRPRVAPSGRRPDYAEGFKAEFWIWGYALAAAVLAVTLNVIAFYAILGASVALLWLGSAVVRRRARRMNRPAEG